MITAPMMLQYLMALMGARGGGVDPLHALLGGSDMQPGRMGDYVFNQEGNSNIFKVQSSQSNQLAPWPTYIAVRHVP